MKRTPYFLYVEDDEEDVILLKEMMKSCGREVRMISVSDGFEAIKFLQNVKSGDAYPSLILLDIEMPRLNGPDTLQYLRSDDIYCLIPVLMFSVSKTPKDQVMYQQLGTEVLPKPEDPATWESTIRQICTYVD